MKNFEKTWIDTEAAGNWFIVQKNDIDLSEFPNYLEAIEYAEAIQKTDLKEKNVWKIYFEKNRKIEVCWTSWI